MVKIVRELPPDIIEEVPIYLGWVGKFFDYGGNLSCKEEIWQYGSKIYGRDKFKYDGEWLYDWQVIEEDGCWDNIIGSCTDKNYRPWRPS